MNLNLPPSTFVRFSEEELALTIRLYRKGVAAKAISLQTGRPPRSIYNRMNKLGIKSGRPLGYKRQKVLVHVFLPDLAGEKLRKLAHAEGMTLTHYVRRVLLKHLGLPLCMS